MSSGLSYLRRSDLLQNEQLGEDGKDGKTYLINIGPKYSGEYAGNKITLRAQTKVAVKTFKPKKSVAKILKEAEYQTICSKADISPEIYGISVEEKYIVMRKLESLPAKDYHQDRLPDDVQYMMCALMARLDDVSILHGDMNALNVMLDSNGRPYMIDFGFAKKISKTVVKKHGEHPNFTVSLWGLANGFKRHKVSVPILNECVTTAKNGGDLSPWIAQGEELLLGTRRKKRRRR
jgi:predicted Ser/Thr protein kinase